MALKNGETLNPRKRLLSQKCNQSFYSTKQKIFAAWKWILKFCGGSSLSTYALNEYLSTYSEVPHKRAGRICSVFSLKRVIVY